MRVNEAGAELAYILGIVLGRTMKNEMGDFPFFEGRAVVPKNEVFIFQEHFNLQLVLRAGVATGILNQFPNPASNQTIFQVIEVVKFFKNLLGVVFINNVIKDFNERLVWHSYLLPMLHSFNG